MSDGLIVAGAGLRRGGAIVLDDVGFAVPRGGLCAVAGPNGAGKTTLLHLILGLIPDAAGAVRFAGRDLRAMPRSLRARHVAFVAHAAQTDLPHTARDVVLLGRIPHGTSEAEDDAAADRAMAVAGAGALADRTYRSLSGGEQQRVQIARALAQEPALLVLDEPTGHLDLKAQTDVLSLLRARADAGMTVLAAIHDLTLAAAFFDAILFLAGGKVAAFGSPPETLTADLVRDVYGVAATLIENPRTGRPIVVPDFGAPPGAAT